MDELLVPPRFLFRFSAALRVCDPIWTDEGISLPDSCRLIDLAELDDQRPFADVRMAWSQQGIALTAQLVGKRQPVWCRESRLEDSDGLQVWIDTRDTHNIHRASRFCHRFLFLPAGGGPKHDQAVADQLLIHRARENARPIRPEQLQILSCVQADGYRLQACIPADALTGFDPKEHPRIGFTYAVFDRELGLQTYSVGTQFPFREDPSTWATLELTDA